MREALEQANQEQLELQREMLEKEIQEEKKIDFYAKKKDKLDQKRRMREIEKRDEVIA